MIYLKTSYACDLYSIKVETLKTRNMKIFLSLFVEIFHKKLNSENWQMMYIKV